jgi:RNA polymerase sigma-70 factor, ECF subfamily
MNFDIPDDPLLKAAWHGDEQAFAQLLDRHYDQIYRFAYRWSGNKANAEDITQLACLKLARSLRQFRFEARFSTWLYRLVINCAKDWHKTEYRHGAQLEGETPDAADEATDGAEHYAYLQQILRLLDGMADGFKETVLLVLAEGFSHAEAADILGIKENTVSWRIHEIRQTLQRLLQEARP